MGITYYPALAAFQCVREGSPPLPSAPHLSPKTSKTQPPQDTKKLLDEAQLVSLYKR